MLRGLSICSFGLVGKNRDICTKPGSPEQALVLKSRRGYNGPIHGRVSEDGCFLCGDNSRCARHQRAQRLLSPQRKHPSSETRPWMGPLYPRRLLRTSACSGDPGLVQMSLFLPTRPKEHIDNPLNILRCFGFHQFHAEFFCTVKTIHICFVMLFHYREILYVTQKFVEKSRMLEHHFEIFFKYSFVLFILTFLRM